MSGEDSHKLFSKIRGFEWNEKKRSQNLKKHDIDFDDARVAFDGPILVRESNRGAENRYIVLGFLGETEIAVICTFREDRCRIISARRARANEKKELYHRFKRRPETG